MSKLLAAAAGGGLILVLAGCGSSPTAAPTAAATTTSPAPVVTANPTPTAADRVTQCKSISPVLSRISTTLGRVGNRIILGSDAVAELKQEQNDLDDTAGNITLPDLATAAHAVADAIGKERVELATTGTIEQDALDGFTTAAKSFLAVCTS